MLFGKFYHRPPGGESYPDVIMRLRSILRKRVVCVSRLTGARLSQLPGVEAVSTEHGRAILTEFGCAEADELRRWIEVDHPLCRAAEDHQKPDQDQLNIENLLQTRPYHTRYF